MQPTEEQRKEAAAKAKGKVYEASVEIEGGTVVALFHKPSRGEYYALLDAIGAKDAKTAQMMRAHEDFFKSCVLFPTTKELDAMFLEHYNLASDLSNEALKVAAGKARATNSGR